MLAAAPPCGFVWEEVSFGVRELEDKDGVWREGMEVGRERTAGVAGRFFAHGEYVWEEC